MLFFAVFPNGGDHRFGVLVTIDVQRRKAEHDGQQQHGHDRKNADGLPVAAASGFAPTPDAADQRNQTDQSDQRLAGQIIMCDNRNGDADTHPGDDRRNPRVPQPPPRKGVGSLFLRRLFFFSVQPAVDPKGCQHRQGGICRKQIMRQLRLAYRPEYKPYAEPANGQHATVVLGRGESVFLAQGLDGVDQRWAEEDRPGKKAEQNRRNVIEVVDNGNGHSPDMLQRACVAVAEYRLFEGAEVELENELPQPFTMVVLTNHHKPGQRDRRDNDDGCKRPHFPGRAEHSPPSAFDQHEQTERAERQDHADRSLGQHGQADAGVH